MNTYCKFDYDQIVTKNLIVNLLEVQSFEMNIYLLKLHVNGESGMLYSCNNLMRFHNTQQIRDAFKTITVEKALLIQDSAYDEMIGNPVKSIQSMTLPFSMAQPF